MNMLRMILSGLIQHGKVVVEIPGLDMDELRKAIHDQAYQTLSSVVMVVFAEEMNDREKVAELQRMLEDI